MENSIERLTVHVISVDISYPLLTIALVQASRHDEAEQLFRQAQLMAPTDPSVYMLTGKFVSNVFDSLVLLPVATKQRARFK